MLTIVKPTGKFSAICECSRCSTQYPVKDKYGAAKSPIGDLCGPCKSAIINMTAVTQVGLLSAFAYDENSGKLTHKQSTSSGLQGEDATFTHSRGYLSVCVGGKQLLAHRIIFLMQTGRWPTEHVDHINHVKNDNRWCNLREVTQGDNNRNMPQQTNSSYGVIGVNLHRPSGKYRAYITVNGASKHLGLFDTVEAAKAAREKANTLYGYHANHGK